MTRCSTASGPSGSKFQSPSPASGYTHFFFVSTFGIKGGNREKAKRSLNTLTLCAVGVLGAAIWFVGIQAVAIKSFCTYAAPPMRWPPSQPSCSSLRPPQSRINYPCDSNLAGPELPQRDSSLIAAGQVLMPADDHWAKQMAYKQTNKVTQVAQKNAPPAVVKTNTTNTGSRDQHSTSPQASRCRFIPHPTVRHQPRYIETRCNWKTRRPKPVRVDVRLHLPFMSQATWFRSPSDAKSQGHRLLSRPDATRRRVQQTVEEHFTVPRERLRVRQDRLAVQQVAPEKYDAFDQWLFSEHETAKPLELVRNHAEKLVGKEALGQALVSATLQTQLQRNIEISSKLNFKNWNSSNMPQTFIKNQVIFGPPPTAKILEDHLKKEFDLK